jgi:dephospho-CoA kinase
MVKRVKLYFTPRLEVEFVDRDRAIRQIYELAEKGTRVPLVIYGPEGCGKSALLKQAVEVFRERGFDVIYIDALHREFITHTDVKEVVEKLSEVLAETTSIALIKLADIAISLVKDLLRKWGKKKIALLVDEVFQAIGLERSEVYVKSLLNLIEYPPESYENIVVITATSEGLSRWRIGRHRWAWLMPLWNMSRNGFKELYEKIPGDKPPFEYIWKMTGGNPFILSQLHGINWNVDIIVNTLIEGKNLTPIFVTKWRKWLEEAIKDPDTLWNPDTPEELINELTSRNLIVYFLRDRDPALWIDEPPPEKDLELGIGRHVAWQTPLHREAVKKALETYK